MDNNPTSLTPENGQTDRSPAVNQSLKEDHFTRNHDNKQNQGDLSEPPIKTNLSIFVRNFGMFYWVIFVLFYIFVFYIIVESRKPNNSDVGFGLILPALFYELISVIYLVLLIVVLASKKCSFRQKENAVISVFAVLSPVFF